MNLDTTSASHAATGASRRRIRRVAITGGAIVVTAGLGALWGTTATGGHPTRPAVVVSEAAAAADSPPVANTPATTVDFYALVRTLLDLDADQVSVILPALDPNVRAQLEALAAGVAAAGTGWPCAAQTCRS